MMAPLMILATTWLLRNSSMCHLLLVGAYALRAQSFPRQPGIEWVRVRNFKQHLLGAVVVPLLAQEICKSYKDFPICLRPEKWSQCLSNSLHMVIDVSHTTIFFCKGDCWQHHVGLLGCLGRHN